jgi:hypothetical protein
MDQMQTPEGRLLEQHSELRRKYAELERENAAARNALIALDRAMAGVMEYEHAWINAPEKPEITPAKMVRHVLSNVASDLSSTGGGGGKPQPERPTVED